MLNNPWERYMILFPALGDSQVWDEAVSHKKFLGGTYLSGKNRIAGRLRWFVETQMRGPWISVLWSRSLGGSHQEDKFANFSANEISGVTHKAPRTDQTGEESFLLLCHHLSSGKDSLEFQ